MGLIVGIPEKILYAKQCADNKTYSKSINCKYYPFKPTNV